MLNRLNLAILPLTCLLLPPATAQSVVKVRSVGDRFQLIRDGKPYQIRGVGGTDQLAKLAAAGGNTIRTWDSKNLGKVLDDAQKHGLTVCAGLWMGHQRHGFDYTDAKAVADQLQEKLTFVKQHRDHPALLMWGVANEAEGEGNDPDVWKAINQLARQINRIDPNHPTMTVIAELGPGENKIHNIEKFCPDVDIVGLNSYGGIESIGDRFVGAKCSKPYIITEHGPIGPWEINSTAWGSPVEWSSTEKAKFYAKGHRANVIKHSVVCLGSFSFLWGHKQETTATWFGMLLPDGTRLAAADAMSEAWTGTPPTNRCPEITRLTMKQTAGLKPGATVTASVSAKDPENDPVRIKWLVRTDGGTIGTGGDPQEDEFTVRNAVKYRGANAVVTVPAEPGGYRLFAYVYDDKGGAAVANVPFHVAGEITLKSEMKVAALPYVVYGDKAKPDNVFIPSGYMGNSEAVAMKLDCRTNPFAGATCLKAEYKSSQSWGGVLWQSPAEDWEGKLPGGANLSGATHLEFQARGAGGGEVVNFVFGVLDGSQPYRDTAKGELKNVRLTKNWKKYRIALKNLDLRQIKTGFGWSLAGQGKPVTFYLDDIRFVKD